MPKTKLFLDASPSLPRLNGLRRRYQAEESELLLELENACEEFDHWTRTRQQLAAESVTSPAVDRLCDALGERATCLEKDLIDVRSALLSLDEEIEALSQPTWTWVPDVSAVRDADLADSLNRR